METVLNQQELNQVSGGNG
ncbi:MAG: bacteriocin [SAR202 cluster bacterium]|nr:bacteriocin [SAR202 cluster bacterium]